MTQPCPRCGGRGTISSIEDLQITITCPACKGSSNISTDYIQCQSCRGIGYTSTNHQYNGKLITGTVCVSCNKLGIVKSPQTIFREQQAKQQAEQRAISQRLQQEQELTRQANLAIKQRDQQIADLKQRELLLIEQITENKKKIAEMEKLGQQQQANYLELLKLHLKLQEELISLKQTS